MEIDIYTDIFSLGYGYGQPAGSQLCVQFTLNIPVCENPIPGSYMSHPVVNMLKKHIVFYLN